LRKSNFNYRVNHQIRASEVRVVNEEGKQIGIMRLGEALEKARGSGLDLVEIAPTAKPPVTKIVELGKFRYQENKKQKKEKKKSKPANLKEVRFSPFIHKHDFENRIERISEFLNDKHKVRVVVVFLGRQMNSKKFGYDVLNKVVTYYGDKIIIDMEPKFMGRHLVTVISPVNKPAYNKTSIKEEKIKNAKN
jgi:translation initiation factor IF-3